MKAWAGKLYLSLDAQARLKVTDVYSLHRVLLDLVDGERSAQPGMPSGLQWVDRGQTIYGRRVDFLTTLPVPAVCPAEDLSLEIKELPQDFLDHQSYRFQILVNPVRCVQEKRVAVTGEENISAWFTQRAADRGMQVFISSIDKVGRDVFRKKEHRVVYNRARITGTLNVTDKELFQKACLTGIGKGRAFGFGFLQLSVIR